MTVTRPTSIAPGDITRDPMAEVQSQITRVDTKASILIGLALAMLTGGATVASQTHLSGFAVTGAVLTTSLIGAALALLGAAVRPALGGNYGFVRWANAPTVEALHNDLLDRGSWDQPISHLWLMARSAQRKYRRVRLAVDLLGAALASALFTAVLSGLGW